MPGSRNPQETAEQRIARHLRAAGCVFAEEEARLLMAEASTPAALEDMVELRMTGQPLEQILGWAAFHGLRLVVEPGVFIPRRRTEFLASRTIALVRDLARADTQTGAPVVLELCCGVGAVSAAVAAQTGPLELYAADIQPAAVRCARRNLGQRATVFEGDLYEPLPAGLRGRVDIITANAPYVPTGRLATMPSEARLYEPEGTRDGGAEGLDLLTRLAVSAPQWLRPGGSLLLECSEPQAPALSSVLRSCGLVPETVRRESTDSTVIIGTMA